MVVEWLYYCVNDWFVCMKVVSCEWFVLFIFCIYFIFLDFCMLFVGIEIVWEVRGSSNKNGINLCVNICYYDIKMYYI